LITLISVSAPTRPAAQAVAWASMIADPKPVQEKAIT